MIPKYMAGEGPFYTDYYEDVIKENPDYDFINLEWSEVKYPNVAKHKERLCTLFNLRYGLFEIGQETPYRWFSYMQDKLDSILPVYDHSYGVYDTVNIDELGTGYVETHNTTRDTTNKGETSGTDENLNTYKDTPIAGKINNPTNETKDSGTSTGTSKGESKDIYKAEIDKRVHDEHMIDEVNNLITKFKNLDESFLDEFKGMFIGIYFNELEMN